MNSKLLPENIRRCMPTETRREMKLPTNQEAQEKADAVSERQLQKQIVQWFNLHDIFHVVSRMDRKTTNTLGCPDFTLPHPLTGQYLGIEIKVGTNQQTKEQREVEARIKDAKGAYHVCRSLSEVKEILEAGK